MRRPANTPLVVALVLVLCAFVAWPARAERHRGEYVIAGGFLGGVGSGLIIALLVQRQRRRQVEQALSDSEAKFRALFESNLMPMNHWHADGRILEANDAYLRLTGFSREEIKTGHVRWLGPLSRRMAGAYGQRITWTGGPP